MLTAAAAMQGFALRPDHSIARLADSLSTTEPETFLEDASAVVDGILLEEGNATKHLTAKNKKLLERVLSLVDKDLYGSMQRSHDGDTQDVKKGIDDILACNVEITTLQSETGRLGVFLQEVIDLQSELNRLQGIVDHKTTDNNTYWGRFNDHMLIISDPPACPDFPNPRGMATLDVYFKQSSYSAWWTAARSPYFSHRDLYLAADQALRQAILAFNIHKATLDVKYCDYKTDLEAACARFDHCYESRVDDYNNRIVPRVEKNQKRRIRIYKVGKVLLARVKFLLARVNTDKTPPFSTKRFEMKIPPVPDKALCDLSSLTSDVWSHTINCAVCEQGFGIGHTFGVKSWAINDKCTNAITVSSDDSVKVHLEYESWEHGCSNCREQMYVGIRGQELDCIYDGNPNGHLHDDHTLILANLAPGTYQLVATASWQYHCVTRTDGRWIGTVHVQ